MVLGSVDNNPKNMQVKHRSFVKNNSETMVCLVLLAASIGCGCVAAVFSIPTDPGSNSWFVQVCMNVGMAAPLRVACLFREVFMGRVRHVALFTWCASAVAFYPFWLFWTWSTNYQSAVSCLIIAMLSVLVYSGICVSVDALVVMLLSKTSISRWWMVDLFIRFSVGVSAVYLLLCLY